MFMVIDPNINISQNFQTKGLDAIRTMESIFFFGRGMIGDLVMIGYMKIPFSFYG